MEHVAARLWGAGAGWVGSFGGGHGSSAKLWKRAWTEWERLSAGLN